MLKLTILTSEEIAELQELVDGNYNQYCAILTNSFAGEKMWDNTKRIATILGLEIPNELTTPRRNNGVSKDKEIDNEE